MSPEAYLTKHESRGLLDVDGPQTGLYGTFSARQREDPMSKAEV